MLYRLLSAWDTSRFSGAVVSLVPPGPMGPRIAALGVPVSSLDMRRGLANPIAILKLAWRIRAFAPQVIHTWMYHANLLGGLAARLSGGQPVLWAIHNGTLESGKSSAGTIWSAKTCARLSHCLPKKILCCSESALEIHRALGYSAEKMCFIPNGIDLEQFKPDPEARRALRGELGISENDSLVGLVGRFDPQKDHATFVRASGLLRDHWPESHFVLCGSGLTWANAELCRWIGEAGMRSRFHLLGPRDDLSRITAALDVSCLCSTYGEAFPLVVGEAMACGVPCVSTDVGDCSRIIGETGFVSAPGDAEALARGIEKILEMGSLARNKLGEAARSRIQENYSLSLVVQRYENLYRAVANVRGAEATH